MKTDNEKDQLVKVVDRNIHSLLKRKKEHDEKKSVQTKIVTGIANFAGNMLFVYMHIFMLVLWIVINKGLTPLKIVDPDFVILGTVAAVEALFLSTFVLIGQKHNSVEEDKRAELALQVSLLTEHEVTRVLMLSTAIAKKLGMEHIISDEIEDLSKDIKPETVLNSMEKAAENSEKK